MLRRLFGDRGTRVLATMLDITSLRHRVLANNIANADTPGFKRADVEFQQELASALNRSDVQALSEIKPKITNPSSESAHRNDGNNVEIDIEMVRMAENYLLYNVNAQLLSKRLTTLKAAIAGRV